MSCMKRVWRRLFGNKPMRVLLLGLDAAGKTTILYQLMGKGESTVPTIGFNVETVRVPPLEFLVWDVSGQDRLRSFWRHYYHGTTGIVFVVDSHDVERLPIARKELHGILKEEELQHAVVLIIANKTDLPQAVGTEQLREALDLRSLQGRIMHIQPAIAHTGVGLREGLFWLAKAMKQQQKTLGNAAPNHANAAHQQQQQQNDSSAMQQSAQLRQSTSVGPAVALPSSSPQQPYEVTKHAPAASNHISSSSSSSSSASSSTAAFPTSSTSSASTSAPSTLHSTSQPSLNSAAGAAAAALQLAAASSTSLDLTPPPSSSDPSSSSSPTVHPPVTVVAVLAPPSSSSSSAAPQSSSASSSFSSADPDTSSPAAAPAAAQPDTAADGQPQQHEHTQQPTHDD